MSIRAAENVRVHDAWLFINSYPSGFGVPNDRPHGKVRIVLHHAGTLHAQTQLTGIWTATTLFSTNSLDVTLYYDVDHHVQGWPVAHVNVTA